MNLKNHLTAFLYSACLDSFFGSAEKKSLDSIDIVIQMCKANDKKTTINDPPRQEELIHSHNSTAGWFQP